MRKNNINSPNGPSSNPKSCVSVAYVSSYLPRRCGIATFTNDLVTSIDKLHDSDCAEIIAMTDNGQKYDYSDRVKFEINQFSKADYEAAAEYINKSSVDAVSLQHEFGLHTGPNRGSSSCLSSWGTPKSGMGTSNKVEDDFFLLSMIDRIEKPIVTTFHTVLESPDSQQMYIVRKIVKKSAMIVSMSETSRKILIDVYDCPAEKVVVICHGVPDFEFDKTAKYQKKLGIKDANPLILAAGLIGPGKGLEYTIDAMPAILKQSPSAKLYIVGQTHPVVLKNEGETYRNKLIDLIEKNGISDSVVFVNEYLSDENLHDYFQAADFFVTSYSSVQQSTSGMLSWGLSAGKVCVSTPYQHAKELLSDGSGILVSQESPARPIGESIVNILRNPDLAQQMRKKAYTKGHQWIWANVAKEYTALFKNVSKK
jgi:glycosyltransferase involved in cell wall biosynthesis